MKPISKCLGRAPCGPVKCGPQTPTPVQDHYCAPTNTMLLFPQKLLGLQPPPFPPAPPVPSPSSPAVTALTPTVTHSGLPVPHAVGTTVPHRRTPQREALLTLEAQVATHGVSPQPRGVHAVLKGSRSWTANSCRERKQARRRMAADTRPRRGPGLPLELPTGRKDVVRAWCGVAGGSRKHKAR